MAGYNNWPKVAAQLQQGCTDLVANTATKGVQHVQEHIDANGQVNTGFMKGSVYANTSQGSTYGQGGTPPGDSYLLPEAGPASQYTSFFGCAANYSIYQAMGTRYLPARDFWNPGVDETAVDFDTGMAQLAAQLGNI